MPWDPLPRRYTTEPQPLRGALDRIAQSLGAPDASAMSTLFSQWPSLVGEAVAAHTRPLRLRDGVLTVGVDDPAWSTQLRLLENQVRERINQTLGAEVVQVLRTRVVADPGRITGS